MRRKAARLGVAAVLVVGVVCSGGTAAAHASLTGSTPEDGAVLAEAPDEVVLEFDEQMQPDFSQVAVLDAEENHYEDGEPQTEGQTVTQAVSEMPAGEYSISYRVGSADGHPVTGVIEFTVEPSGGDGTADDPAADEPVAGGATEPATSGGESGEDTPEGEAAASEQPEDGTSTASVAAVVAAVVVVGIAGALVLRRRPGDEGDDSPPSES